MVIIITMEDTPACNVYTEYATYGGGSMTNIIFNLDCV